jgi:hypothetical protein
MSTRIREKMAFGRSEKTSRAVGAKREICEEMASGRYFSRHRRLAPFTLRRLKIFHILLMVCCIFQGEL